MAQRLYVFTTSLVCDPRHLRTAILIVTLTLMLLALAHPGLGVWAGDGSGTGHSPN